MRDGTWAVQIYFHNHKYFGGYFNEEIEAAKKVNQLCDEVGIPQKNPEVNEMPITNSKVIENFIFSLTWKSSWFAKRF